MSRQPERLAKPDLDPRQAQIDASMETEGLRDAVAKLREAVAIEAIEPDGPLGVFAATLEAVLLSLGALVETQTVRIEQRANATAAASAKGIEEMRAATLACRAQATLSEEQNRGARLALASDLAEDLRKTLKGVMVIREVRWNRRQNWAAAAALAGVLFACFIGGGVWTNQNNVRAVLDRCLSKESVDRAGIVYCPMTVVADH